MSILKWLGMYGTFMATLATVKAGQPAPVDLRGIRHKGKSYRFKGTLEQE